MSRLVFGLIGIWSYGNSVLLVLGLIAVQSYCSEESPSTASLGGRSVQVGRRDSRSVNNFVFTRSQHGVNGFQKFRKILKAISGEIILEIGSVLLSAMVSSELAVSLTNS